MQRDYVSLMETPEYPDLRTGGGEPQPLAFAPRALNSPFIMLPPKSTNLRTHAASFGTQR